MTIRTEVARLLREHRTPERALDAVKLQIRRAELPSTIYWLVRVQASLERHVGR